MESLRHCVVCQKSLQGRQRRFCSRPCKNRDTNHRHQNYVNQQARGLRRKKRLVAEAGGSCTRCGYQRNFAALAWHHADPRAKAFTLDLRALSNRSEKEIRNEIEKCALVCANCHAEIHFPELMNTHS